MTTIWVLTDDRAGNSNQAIALAQLLEIPYILKSLSYNKMAMLPNFLRLGLNILSKACKNDLLSSPLPDMIISAGRRSALIATSLKKQKPSLKIIQLMNPELPLKDFALVIMPKHDYAIYQDHAQVIYIDGAFTTKQEVDKNQWDTHLASPNPKVGILVGGPSKSCKFNQNHIDYFLGLLKNINSPSLDLLISYSRRTPQNLASALKELYPFFIAGPNFGRNPLHAICTYADVIVVTGDSISMCSEVLHYGKPTFVYYEDNMLSSKHLRFINSLIDDGKVQPLEAFSLNNQARELQQNTQNSKIKNIIWQIIANNEHHK
jgi:mitochondrial fission protein ELM1